MDYLDAVQEHIELSLGLTNSLLLSLKPLYREDFGIGQEVTVPLYTLLHSTSINILNLVMEKMALHDADVLLRTVMEGTIKYCYLMNGTVEERRIKYEEYRYMLHDLELVNDHIKAKETLSVFEEFNLQNSTLPFEANLLQDNQLRSLQSRYSNKEKNELRKKWTYQAMLRSLATSKEQYKAQLGTLSTYATTSHFAHWDWTGLSSRLVQLRSVATEEEMSYDIAHCYRIISNILSFELFRVLEHIQVYGLKSNDTIAIINEIYDEIAVLDTRSNQLLEEAE